MAQAIASAKAASKARAFAGVIVSWSIALRPPSQLCPIRGERRRGRAKGGA